MTDSPSTRRPIARCLLLASVALGCASQEFGPLLGPAAHAGAAPPERRVPLQLEGEELKRFLSRHIVGDAMTPFEDPIHDPARDRFVLPGLWSIDREGVVTFDPDPLVGPQEAVPQKVAELRAALDLDPGVHVIIAVFDTGKSLNVLHSVLWKNQAHPHGERTKADVLLLRRVESGTLRVLDDLRLPLVTQSWMADIGWEPRATVARFLRDGSIIAALDLAPWNRDRLAHGFGGRLPVPPGASQATVRVAANGEVSVITRRHWRTAVLSADGEIFGVLDRKRSALLVFDPDGKRRFRVPLSFHPRAVASHAQGVCVLATTGLSRHGSGVITCFDRSGRERWRRSLPSPPDDWLVDDDGWTYFRFYDTGAARLELVAIDPTGATAWRLRQPAAMGKLMPVGDDELCFVTEEPRGGHTAFVPELVCVQPRHGLTQSKG